VITDVKGPTVEDGLPDPLLPARGHIVKGPRAPACRRIPVALALLPAVLACGHKSGREATQSRDPVAVHDAVQPADHAAPSDSLAVGARHTHLKGTQTEAICTSLADVQQFYVPGQDNTQESLSCSMIFGGQSTADVAVLATQGAYVHVRLYDKTGHFSDGYMRGQALR
jgi:hypothetical protein